MKPLLVAGLLFANIPAIDAPKNIVRVLSRYNSEYDRPCVIETREQRGIQLRFIPEEQAVQRIVTAFYSEWEGKLELAPYGQVARVESIGKVSAVKIAEQGKIAVWAYREADGIVVFTPGISGTTTSTNGDRFVECPMATAVLSTRPASECSTTDGCGRMAVLDLGKSSVIAGVSDGTLSARITARK